MKRTCPVLAIALAGMLAGCSDFSQRRISGIRHFEDVAQHPPKAAPALQIPNSPVVVARNPIEEPIQKATFIPAQPAVNQKASDNPLRGLYQRAADQQSKMESYIFRLRRREVVSGKKMPEELIRAQVRRDPFSVHLKWLGAEGKGRETIYVKGKYKNEMQVLMAANDLFPLSPAGMKWKLPPDDPLARARSRYPITSTGFESIIDRFGKIVTAVEKGDTNEGSLKYLGKMKRPEFEAEVEAAHQVLPAKCDPNLPKGGQRWFYFDATHGWPVLVIANDPDGEVEYYCHDHIQWPVRLDDDDFNPERLWRK